jgi:uncharacterized protein YrrD
VSRLADVVGKDVLSKESAEKLGQVVHVALRTDPARLDALAVKSGRHTGLVRWADVTSLGPDAVIVTADAARHDPADDDDKRLADGTADPMGKRLLTDAGNVVGAVDDVEFDPATGAVGAVVANGEVYDASRVRGIGSYAVVVSAR